MAGSQFQPTQRVVYRSTVDAMAAAMKAGTFNWSGMDDPIIVDGRQILLQGHHRVVAARLANVRIPQSAVSVREGDSGRDPRPWSSVTVKAGEKP
jgi:ParB-like chromosome segregation protein Spo0J